MEDAEIIEELRDLYLKGENQKILDILFGKDKNFFDFSEYKEKSGWNNKDFNPLHDLIGLAEFILASTESKTDEEKIKEFKLIGEYYVPA